LWDPVGRTRGIQLELPKMKMVAEYLEQAAHFERLASSEVNAHVRQQAGSG
jgi:hypothetical protein